MERTEIIKALECCSSKDYDCEKCHYFPKGTRSVPSMELLMHDALALIKELTVELDAMRGAANSYKMHNERLTEENERLSTSLANYDRQTEVRIAEDYYTAEAYDELREENERWRAECENPSVLWRQHFESVYQTSKETVKTAVKADTVREFAERLKSEMSFGRYIQADQIDRIANEILNNTEEEKK